MGIEGLLGTMLDLWLLVIAWCCCYRGYLFSLKESNLVNAPDSDPGNTGIIKKSQEWMSSP
jgi:hypothetical protein